MRAAACLAAVLGCALAVSASVKDELRAKVGPLCGARRGQPTPHKLRVKCTPVRVLAGPCIHLPPPHFPHLPLQALLFEDFDSEGALVSGARWVHSSAEKYSGRFELASAPDWEGDQGLRIPDKARHYGVTAVLRDPVEPVIGPGLPLVLQVGCLARCTEA
jgi:hypothetical protein